MIYWKCAEYISSFCGTFCLIIIHSGQFIFYDISLTQRAPVLRPCNAEGGLDFMSVGQASFLALRTVSLFI